MESLAVKYRPKKFEDVVGQNPIVKILTRQLELNEFKNCYLFCGPSGCGKTTIARIFADRINDGVGLPIEIDAASNNGVENVKNIVAEAKERSVHGKYKIYIIDECHSLTSQAWQAFLKCIEEPPAFTIFMFATTDPQKIPDTILNRCMRFNIQKIPSSQIRDRLNFICKSEGFSNYIEVTDLISKMCKNQCRDAIALLDKVAAYSTVFDLNIATSILGGIPNSVLFALTNAIIDDDEATALKIIYEIYANGSDLKLFVDLYLMFVLDIEKYVLLGNLSITNFSEYDINMLKSTSNFKDANKYFSWLADKVLSLKNMIKTDTNYKSTIEVAILQMCRLI